MKVLEVAGSGTVGTPDAGPVSSVIGHLCNALDRDGHSVVLADASGVEPRRSLADTVTVHDCLPPNDAIPGSRLPGVGAQVAAAQRGDRIRRLIHEVQPDIVHVHDAAIAQSLSRQRAAPLLWTAHGLNWTLEPARRRAGPRYRLLRRQDRLACHRVDHVVVLNRTTRAALPMSNATTIPNGIDLAAWPVIERRCARAYLGWSAQAFRVVFVGRLAPEKGVDVFARAMDRLPEDVPLIAEAMGSPAGAFGNATTVTPYARRLLEGGHRVNFLGFIHRDTPEYRCRLAAADVVVVPSITEPFGLVVLEALACGARVIGSDVGGIRDMLGGGLGRLVPPGDADALARALLDEYRQPNARPPEAIRSALADYTWERCGRSYATLMQTLVRDA